MKRFISFLLIAMMLVSCMGLNAFAADEHEHEYSAYITGEATCSAPGEMTYICSVTGCGDSYTEVIAPNGQHKCENGKCTICGTYDHEHVYANYIVEDATCTTEGKQECKCTVGSCEYSHFEAVKALGHNYINGICFNCGGAESEPVKQPVKSSAPPRKMVKSIGTEITVSDVTSLKTAIDNANSGDGGTIKLTADITLSEKLTIKKNITISGPYTITRGIAGTIFAVDKNATLTLDGGLVIDGNNNWSFDEAGFYADMAAGLLLSTGAKNDYSTSAEGGLVATANMITISSTNGQLVMDNATIQNSWGSYIFSVPAGATLTMNDGSLIQHIRGQLINPLKGTWVINAGKITDVFSHNVNGGLTDIRDSGRLTIKGGEICNIKVQGNNANGNGIIVQVFGNSSKLTMNGGNIHDNASFSPGGGWGSAIYLNRGGDFEMNGGSITTTASDHCTAFVSNTSTSIVLNGGTISVEPSKVAKFDSLLYGNVTIGKDMTITGDDDALTCFLGDTGNSIEINGTIEGGTAKLMHESIGGTGTINSDVLITPDDYFEFDGKTSITGGTWNGNIELAEGASLSISGGTFKGEIKPAEGATLSITGGSFASPVGEFLADGYCASKDANGLYVVSAGAHKPKAVAETPATYTAEGMKAHYACENGCGVLFSDAEGRVKVTKAELVIPKLVKPSSGGSSSSGASSSGASSSGGGGYYYYGAPTTSTVKIDKLVELKSGETEVRIPTKELSELKGRLIVRGEFGSLSFNNNALKALVKEAGCDAITVKVEIVSADMLSEAQQAALAEHELSGMSDIFRIQLIDCSGNLLASEAKGGFGSGALTVTLSHKVEDGSSPADYEAFCIGDSLVTVPMDFDGKQAKLTLSHLSDYVIAREAEPAVAAEKPEGENLSVKAEAAEMSHVSVAQPVAAEAEGSSSLMKIIIGLCVATVAGLGTALAVVGKRNSRKYRSKH